jgi:hypothetical protein
MKINEVAYHAPAWSLFPAVVLGFLLLAATMHLAGFVGRKHGGLAKAMLVRA